MDGTYEHGHFCIKMKTLFGVFLFGVEILVVTHFVFVLALVVMFWFTACVVFFFTPKNQKLNNKCLKKQ